MRYAVVKLTLEQQARESEFLVIGGQVEKQ